MPKGYDELHALLERAGALNDARDYPALVELLEPLAEEDLHREPMLAFLLADVLRRVGRGAEALAVLEALEPVLARRGNDRLGRRRLNLLGSLHFEQGRMEEARASWERQLQDATSAGDDEFVARANNNLGVLATLATDWEAALVHYSRAVGVYRKLGYRRGLGQSHHNLGITYREMGLGREAAEHFRQASHHALGESDDELARVDQERALLLLLQGDSALAGVTASRALDRYRALGDPSGQGEAERVLGLVALSDRRVGQARDHLRRALDLAAQAHAALLEAEVVEALAALARVEADTRRAEALERKAGEAFAGIGADAWGRNARARARGIARLHTGLDGEAR